MEAWEENEKKKEYLRGYKYARRREQRILEQIQQLRLDAMFPCIQGDGMPRGSSQSDLSDYMESWETLMEKLKEEHEKGLMTSVIFLKKLLELARDTVAAVKKANAAQPEPTREEKGKAALTELFKEARNAKTPVIVERIVDEIDGIVRIVRFPGWQDTETGRREVSMELYGIFARKKLFDKDLVEKAYKYVEQYY